MLQSLNHAELATAVCILSLFTIALFIFTWYFLIRIGQIQHDFMREDNAQSEYFNKLYAQLKVESDKQSKRIGKMEDVFSTPLYEVGTIVEYNKGLDGTSGVHPNCKGEIIGITKRPNDEPLYEVLDHGIGQLVPQSQIIAWYE